MDARRPARFDPILATWLVLVTMTLVTWVWGNQGVAGAWLVVPALSFALVKGKLLVDHFMEARYAATFWRVLLGGYLVVVTAGIGAAFLIP
ncbi:MAG: cytochrome C oxidase subunit IV family protein [Candidatus Competibacterales bacterium]|nr:cytochrome C oxidase subunit IV family protein [Candidatus Competibacterales bacterium]